MRGKLPYDSGKRGSSIGSRKRVGLSGDPADSFSSYTTSFLPFPSASLSLSSVEATKSNTTNTTNTTTHTTRHTTTHTTTHKTITTSARASSETTERCFEFPRALFGVDRTALPALLKLSSKKSSEEHPSILIPFPHQARIYLSTISHTENTATSPPLHLSIHQSCAPMKEKGFRLAQSNGQKNGFATGISHWKRKASSTEQTLAFPSRAKSFEQRRLHRCCLLCALHAGACFRLGATTTTIWRFSSAADPQTIYFFLSPHSLFRS